MKRFRLAAAAVVAGLTAAVAVPASPASAATGTPRITATRTVQYHCVEPPYPDAETAFDVTFSAPVLVLKGTTIDVTATVKATTAIPIDVPANGVAARVEVVIGGTESGSVYAEGLTNSALVPAGELMKLTGGVAHVPTTRAGVLTFTPGIFESTNWLGQHLVCTPTETPAIASVTVVVG